jgi:hypothetical protein
MSKLYRSREGDVTAVDTKTQLTTLGSQSAPGPLLVPAGAKTLAALHVAFAPDHAAANDNVILVRLEGPGLPEGPECYVIGASGNAVATGGASTDKAVRMPCEIPVTPSNEILVFGEMAGEDGGTIRVGVTCEFDL